MLEKNDNPKLTLCHCEEQRDEAIHLATLNRGK